MLPTAAHFVLTRPSVQTIVEANLAATPAILSHTKFWNLVRLDRIAGALCLFASSAGTPLISEHTPFKTRDCLPVGGITCSIQSTAGLDVAPSGNTVTLSQATTACYASDGEQVSVMLAPIVLGQHATDKTKRSSNHSNKQGKKKTCYHVLVSVGCFNSQIWDGQRVEAVPPPPRFVGNGNAWRCLGGFSVLAR